MVISDLLRRVHLITRTKSTSESPEADIFLLRTQDHIIPRMCTLIYHILKYPRGDVILGQDQIIIKHFKNHSYPEAKVNGDQELIKKILLNATKEIEFGRYENKKINLR